MSERKTRTPSPATVAKNAFGSVMKARLHITKLGEKKAAAVSSYDAKIATAKQAEVDAKVAYKEVTGEDFPL